MPEKQNYVNKKGIELKTKNFCIKCGVPRHPKAKEGLCNDCIWESNKSDLIQRSTDQVLSWGYKIIDYSFDKNKHLTFNLITPCCGTKFFTVHGNLVKGILNFQNKGLNRVPCPSCGARLKSELLSERNKKGCPEKSLKVLKNYNAIRTAHALQRHQSQQYNDFRFYASYVRYLSNKTFNKHYYLINPLGLKRENDFNLDHIVSIHYCFHNNISAIQCSSKENLQILSNIENRQKHHHLSDRSLEVLEAWNKSSSL
jgi:hypothetical protein